MLKLWAKNFINLIYPLTCLTCRVRLNPLSDKPLCERCWKRIEYNPPPFCRICGKHLPFVALAKEGLPAKNQDQALICQDCQGCGYFFKQVRSVCIYSGIIKECIHLFKYNSKLSLVKSLSKLMIDFAHSFLNLQNIDLILPVPLHDTKQRLRQFNQAQILASSLRRATAKELNSSSLIKVKRGREQINLSRRRRWQNVQGSFKVKNAHYLKNKQVLLVDDVFTTGATANECAKVLLASGANRVDVFTLARGMQK